MTLEEYLPLLTQLIIGLGIAIALISASALFGQRAARTKIKDSAYECGLPMTGKAHPRFPVKFYTTALLFMIFDIEVVFLIPWALVYRDFLQNSLPIVLPGIVFIGALTLGLVYEMKKGALEWEK